MNTSTFWVVVLVLAAIGVAAVAYAVWRERRRVGRNELREHFGPEYERAVEQHGSGKAARRELRSRMKRISRYPLRELTQDEHIGYSRAWDDVQARFVDDPMGTVRESNRLVQELMRTRGYPVGDFDQQVADLSVYHGNVVQHYRAATALARGVDEGSASTEDLRQAMVHFRALFADLLTPGAGTTEPAKREVLV